MNLEIRHARVVAVLAETGSISKAAAKLGLPQPSLTAQLRRIERMFGGELFVRSRNGIAPSRFGDTLIPMLEDLARRADAVSLRASAEFAETLLIGTSDPTPVAFRRAIGEVLPHQHLQSLTLDHAVAAEMVDSGVLTAAILRVPDLTGNAVLADYQLASAVIAKEPVWLAVPDGHPLVEDEPVPWTALRGTHWVGHVDDHWLRRIEQHVFSQYGIADSTVMHRADSQAEALAWVSEAQCVALVSPTGPRHPVRLLALSDPPVHRLVLAWRPGNLPETVSEQLVVAARRSYLDQARAVPAYWESISSGRSEAPTLTT